MASCLYEEATLHWPLDKRVMTRQVLGHSRANHTRLSWQAAGHYVGLCGQTTLVVLLANRGRNDQVFLAFPKLATSMKAARVSTAHSRMHPKPSGHRQSSRALGVTLLVWFFGLLGVVCFGGDVVRRLGAFQERTWGASALRVLSTWV